jgi:acetylornithine deacetylase
MSAVDEALLVELAVGLAAIPSVSGSEAAIASWLAERLEAAGADVALQEVEPGRPNVIATVELPEPGPVLLLNGHLDTLPVDPAHPSPFDARVEDGWIYGAGINNMKAPVAALATAMLAVRDGGARRGRIVLSAVIGECDALGLGTVYALEHGLIADACLNGEPTELRVLTEHNGVSQLEILVSGREVHMFELASGENAIAAAARIVTALEPSVLTGAEGGLDHLPILNVGTISGGLLPSLTAAECRLGVDVRSTGQMTPESIRADVARAAEAAAGEGFAVEVVLRGRPAFVQQRPFRTDPSTPLLRAVTAALEAETGTAPEVGPHWPESFFGTDASHIAAAGIPTVICGPGSHSQISRPDERVALAEVVVAARVYERAIRAFLDGGTA